ncbi:MAG: TetR/AcrR family transcriptional regulator C-terminal domain-containing protein [Candidatus Onthomonas sp.]
MNTKRTLAASLKKLLAEKPCSKITVSELVQDCGLNRKTFYYHFSDLTALMKWMFEQEAVEVFKQFDLLTDCEKAINFVIDYVDSNTHIINCIYDSMGHDCMKQFLFDDFYGITRTAIDSVAVQLDVRLSEDFLQFLSRFYSEAMAGTLIDWFQNRLTLKREDVVSNLVLIFRHSLPHLLRAQAEVERQN